MIKQIYGIFDKKANNYMQIMMYDNQTAVIRDLKIVVNNNQSGNYLNIYADDFDLVLIALFDTETGQIKSNGCSSICVLSSLKEVNNV